MNDMGLRGKRALVTGGASGIGAGVVDRLCTEGCVVTVLDVRPVGDDGDRLSLVQGDVSSETDVRNAACRAAGPDGTLHCLVNSAGVLHTSPVDALGWDDWRTVLDVNVGGCMLAAKHAMPFMKAAGGGSIVNCSSIMAYNSAPGAGAYSASKAAMLGLSRAIALDGAPHQVRCNTICPGTIDTPMYRRYLADHPDAESEHQRLVGLYPLGRLGTAEDVAGLIAFLLSDQAAWITGQEFVVDGGYLASGTNS